jgi:hypothetical protein
MVRLNQNMNLAADSHLKGVLEPLVNYISAANRPRATLKTALAVLLSEIEETNRAARAHVTTFKENHWS